jgi:hypothetical protein
MDRFDKKQRALVNRLSAELRAIYLSVIQQVANMSVNYSNLEYAFANHPDLNRKVNELMRMMHSDINTLVLTGVQDCWEIANNKHDLLFQTVFGKKAKLLPSRALNRYLAPNIHARDAFLNRLEGGLNLSQRIWRNTAQFKQELELALEFAVSKGQSAKTTAIQMSRYLNNPIVLRENVNSRFGEQRLLNAVDVARPGRGMYRSSYKNAMRLTRNETNFAYESAQMLRRQQQDFIVGINISVAPNYDISLDKGGIVCADLQGTYPKDFDFSQKWHVNCRCVATNILKTRDEIDEDTERIIKGQEVTGESVNRVTEVSNLDYIKEVEELTKNWKRRPVWLETLKMKTA